MNHDNIPTRSVQKPEWVSPEVKRLETGLAESQRGATPDGGGGNQGS